MTYCVTLLCYHFPMLYFLAESPFMLGFQTEFVTNFRIPAYVGMGKMVSKGFGLVEYVTIR